MTPSFAQRPRFVERVGAMQPASRFGAPAIDRQAGRGGAARSPSGVTVGA